MIKPLLLFFFLHFAHLFILTMCEFWMMTIDFCAILFSTTCIFHIRRIFYCIFLLWWNLIGCKKKNANGYRKGEGERDIKIDLQTCDWYSMYFFFSSLGGSNSTTFIYYYKILFQFLFSSTYVMDFCVGSQ